MKTNLIEPLDYVLIDKKESLILSQLYEDKESVSVADILSLLEYQQTVINELEEENRNLKQDIEENYEPIPLAEQYGISDRDFI